MTANGLRSLSFHGLSSRQFATSRKVLEVTLTDEALVTASDIGCWVAGSGHNRAEEINAQTIELAERYGRAVDADISDAITRLSHGLETGTDSQWLSEEADSAVEWLNDRVAPAGCYFTFDDGLMMYGDDDD